MKVRVVKTPTENSPTRIINYEYVAGEFENIIVAAGGKVESAPGCFVVVAAGGEAYANGGIIVACAGSSVYLDYENTMIYGLPGATVLHYIHGLQVPRGVTVYFDKYQGTWIRTKLANVELPRWQLDIIKQAEQL